MSASYDKLTTLLKELFQLNRPELDFGLYRIMHARSAEVTEFLEEDLLPQVEKAFAQYSSADKAELEKELETAAEQAKDLGADPETTPKVIELRGRLRDEAVDVSGLESEVYDHLYRFFRRYYSEGDFLSKRVYKPGVYAIPYEGEEVKLHWANADQYYIKTSEYLRDYAFRLRPGSGGDPMRVHFRLMDAVEGEHGNVKEGKDRDFVLAPGGETGRDFIAEETGEGGTELVIRFEYRPATMEDWPPEKREEERERLKNPKPPKQKDLDALAAERVLAVSDAALAPWITELGKPHVLSSGEEADYTRLEAHLRRYNARHTFDYFIHKDLGGFLRRELDFYIKNEIMHLDDIENESVPRVEQYLSKIKVIRRIAGKIIDFLAQLENFQKKLWLKKKFVVETHYCIPVGSVPEQYYAEIAVTEAQRHEWERFHGIDRIGGDLVTAGYSVPLTPEFLKSNPNLVVDSANLDTDLRARILAEIDDLDQHVDGMLLHSENFQGLRLLINAMKGNFRFFYIDPPYNTESDDFVYKDNYRHSSWISLMVHRLSLAHTLLDDEGAVAVSIDQNSFGLLRTILDQIFGRDNLISTITVKRATVSGPKVINPGVVNVSDYVLIYAKDRRTWVGHPVYAARGRDRRYNRFIRNREDSPDSWEFCSLLDAFSEDVGIEKRRLKKRLGDEYEERLHDFVKEHSDSVFQLALVRPSDVSSDYRAKLKESASTPDRVIHFDRPGMGRTYLLRSKLILFYSDKIRKVGQRKVTAERASDIWSDVLPNDVHNEGGVTFGKGKKPEALLARLVELCSDSGDFVGDFFLGSGTLAAVAHKLGRRWIGIEAGEFFRDVTLRRIKNVIHGEGRGISEATTWQGGGIVRYAVLESYEDTLNNLETRRTDAQQDLLDSPEARGADGFREDYLLRYMLDVETRGSASLLDIGAFVDPTAYRLKVKQSGSDESREAAVDLIETFNWLIGLTVERFAAPEVYHAAFDRDSEGRLRLDGSLERDDDGPHWFRTVTGTTPDGRRTLVIWRRLTGTPEEDNLVLDEWFREQGYSDGESEFDSIYVNGGNNLENLRAPEETWKVRLIEDDFRRLMFETEAG